MSTANAPSGRYAQTAVWTGSKMIIWGGSDDNGCSNSGGIYDPVNNSWTAVTLTNAPSARALHTAVWTGTKMIVWGGSDGNGTFNDGGIYDPAANTWTTTSLTNAPSSRTSAVAVWTGTRMIVWGGGSGLNIFNSGGIFNPVSNTWSPTTLTNAPLARFDCTAIWTGTNMIIWGGSAAGNVLLNTGGIYDNTSLVEVHSINSEVPGGFELKQNYPNPFNPSTKIRFSLPNPTEGGARWVNVSLIVYDVLGRSIAELIPPLRGGQEGLSSGNYEVTFDASGLSSGIYFYKLSAGDFTKTNKMILIK